MNTQSTSFVSVSIPATAAAPAAGPSHDDSRCDGSLLSRTERREFDAAWRKYCAGRAMPPAALILQALLRGRNPRAGFSPITNATKLANGQRAWQGYDGALADARRRAAVLLAEIWPTRMGPGHVAGRHETLARELAALLAQKEAQR